MNLIIFLFINYGKSIEPSKGKFLYHTTSLENIPSILKNGLLSRKNLESTNQQFNDISNKEILEERKKLQDDLTNYVPFHFIPSTPFEKGLAERHGSENLAIVAIYRPNEDTKKNSYKIIPSHPLSKDNPEMVSYQQGMKEINWNAIDSYSKSSENQENEGKTETMAECLVPGKVDPKDIAYIFVSSKSAYDRLSNELKSTQTSSNNIQTRIINNQKIFQNSDWYDDIDTNVNDDDNSEGEVDAVYNYQNNEDKIEEIYNNNYDSYKDGQRYNNNYNNNYYNYYNRKRKYRNKKYIF